jgi:acylphosphatase
MTIQLRILVSGKVQGVFFRASAKQAANKLSITGWVRNLHTGQVEINAAGESKAIEQFINWCNHGPKFARVEKVVTEPLQATVENESFEIR